MPRPSSMMESRQRLSPSSPDDLSKLSGRRWTSRTYMQRVFLRDVQPGTGDISINGKGRCICYRVILAGLFCAALTEHLAGQQAQVPFDVCARSETWTRPSADVQAKIWNDPRYRDIGPDAFEWTHSFIPAEPDSASIQYSIMQTSGVWTEAVTGRCPWRGAERGSWTEIWSLNYHIQDISLRGLVYTVTVAPRERGYEIIQFRRPLTLGNSLTVLRFATANDNVLTQWRETEPSAFDPR